MPVSLVIWMISVVICFSLPPKIPENVNFSFTELFRKRENKKHHRLGFTDLVERTTLLFCFLPEPNIPEGPEYEKKYSEDRYRFLEGQMPVL